MKTRKNLGPVLQLICVTLILKPVAVVESKHTLFCGRSKVCRFGKTANSFVQLRCLVLSLFPPIIRVAYG
jgi:hypothetical protein